MIELIVRHIDNAAVNAAFGLAVIFSFVLAMILFMFVALIIRSVWRWLSQHSWNDAIVSAERKAFRGK